MRLSISFDIMWSPGAAIYTKSFLFSHSKWISQGRWKSKIDKVWLTWMGRKMRSCKWHTFWMVPWLIRCFIVILYWEKMTFYEKFSHSVILETQIFWKISAFQCYWWKCQNVEIYLNFHKFQLKWKTLKHFTRPKQWAAFMKYSTHKSSRSQMFFKIGALKIS